MSVIMLLGIMTAFAMTASAAPATQPALPANDGEVAFVKVGDSDAAISTCTAGEGEAVFSDTVIGVKRLGSEVNSLAIEPAAIIDATNTQWFEFYIDTTEYEISGESFSFYCKWFDALGAIADSYGGNDLLDYELLIDGKWEEYQVTGGGTFQIPAEFAGYIRFSVSSILNSISPYVGTGDKMDISYIYKYWIWFNIPAEDVEANVGKIMYYDNFRFVKDNEKAEEDGNKPVVVEPAAPTQPASPEVKDEKVYFNGTNTDVVASSSSTEITFVDSGDKKLIKAKTVLPGGDVFFTFPGAVNASGRRYLEFWVDTTAATEGDKGIGLKFRIFDALGAVADGEGGNPETNYWIQVDGKWENLTIEDGTVRLPADYSGYVRVDMEDYAKLVTNFIGNGTSIDPSQITAIYVWYPASNTIEGQSVYFNDFRFINDDNLLSSSNPILPDPETTPADTTTAPDTTTAQDTTTANDTTASNDTTAAGTTAAPSDDTTEKAPADDDGSNTGLIIGIAAAVVVIAAVATVIVIKKKRK